MKLRRLLFISVLAVVLVASYAAAYRFLPYRDASRARHAGIFAHYRQFSHDWQVYFFAPAGYVESFIIRANPKPFLSQPSWAELPQVLVLEAAEAKVVFPSDGFSSAPAA